jgi:hypothetical protein
MYRAMYGRIIIAIGDDVAWMLEYATNFATVNQARVVIISGDSMEPIVAINRL